MAQESLLGMIKEVAQKVNSGLNLMRCTAESGDPLKLRFEGDSMVTILDEGIIKPSHIGSIQAGDTVLVSPVGDGDGYLILGVV